MKRAKGQLTKGLVLLTVSSHIGLYFSSMEHSSCQCTGFSLEWICIYLFNSCLLPFNVLCAENKYNSHAISKLNIVFSICWMDCLTVYINCVSVREVAKLNTCCEAGSFHSFHCLKPASLSPWRVLTDSPKCAAFVVLWTAAATYLCIYASVKYLYKI